MPKVSGTYRSGLNADTDTSVPPAPSGGVGPSAFSNTPLEFAESTAVNLEWRLNGLKEMYNVTKGEAKS